MARRLTTSVFAFLLLAALACARESRSQALSSCEWCGAPEAPARLDRRVEIAGPREPGERLLLSGTVYRSDGRTPAAGVLIYAYHTNAAGIYPTRGTERGNDRQHGYLRGWLRTDANGHYEIRTIRPGAYPGRRGPAHIHMTVTPPGVGEYWIDEVLFDDDPRLTPAHRAQQKNIGGSGIVRVTRGGDGVWVGRRDIVLPRP